METAETLSGGQSFEAKKPTQTGPQAMVPEAHPLAPDGGEPMRPLERIVLPVSEGQLLAIIDGREVSLTEKEVAALRLLEQRPGVVTSRKALKAACWGTGVEVSDNAVDQVISGLRGKISSVRLTTVTGRGWEYRPEGVPTLPSDLAGGLAGMMGINYVEKYDVIVVNGKIPKLSAEEHFALRTLAQNAGNLTTRAELQQAVWPADKQPESPNSLSALISRLRKKLVRLEAREAIETIRDEGYILHQAGKPPESFRATADSITGFESRIKLDENRRRVWIDGREVSPPHLDFEILKILLNKPYQFVTTEELNEAWKPAEPSKEVTKGARHGAMSRVRGILGGDNYLEGRTGGYICYPIGKEAYFKSLESKFEGQPRTAQYVSERQVIQTWIPDKGLQEIPLRPLENGVMAILYSNQRKIVSPNQLKAAWKIQEKPEGEPLSTSERAPTEEELLSASGEVPVEEEPLSSIQKIVSSLRAYFGREDCFVNIPSVGYIFYEGGEEVFFASQKSDGSGIIKPVADRQTISVDGRECRVGGLDYRVIEILHKNSGKITTTEELKEAWQGEAPSPFGEAEAQVLHHLREILREILGSSLAKELVKELVKERLRAVPGIGVFFSAGEMPKEEIDGIIKEARKQERLRIEKDLAKAVPPYYDESGNPLHVTPDPERQVAIAGEWAIPLNDLEHGLLTILYENNHKLIPKRALSRAWREGEVTDEMISTEIRKLAARIGKERIRRVPRAEIIYFSEGEEAFQAAQIAKGIIGIRPEPDRQAISINGREIILRKRVYQALETLYRNKGIAVRVQPNLITKLRDVLETAGVDSMKRLVGVYGEGYILFPDELPSGEFLSSLAARTGKTVETKRRRKAETESLPELQASSPQRN